MPFARFAAIAAIATAAALTLPGPGSRAQDSADGSPSSLKLLVPAIDSTKGRQLFVTKGCVYCHAVNGVGGKAAPALDASANDGIVDPTDFAARMWRGAPTMIELQEMDLGYQISLTGEELSHLAGFAADPAEQKKFNEDQVPELMREWYLDEALQSQ